MALVFDIEKFATKDGPGIRTAVFLKGCPLHCLWCHNPESQEAGNELFFHPEKCVGCGKCAVVCPKGCHSFSDGKHLFDRKNCVRCGLCAAECLYGSLEMVAKEMSAEEVIAEVVKDMPFFANSGGGLTLSGGEPMLQFDFTLALLKKAKAHGLHVCLETCGFAPIERYAAIMPFVDIFLFDIKECDDAKHLEYTGVPLAPIIKTLEFLNEKGAHLILRCPIIPGLNARPEHFKFIGELAERLKNVLQVDVEPYHPLGISKSERLGKAAALPNLASFPEKEEAARWLEAIKAHTSKPAAMQ